MPRKISERGIVFLIGAVQFINILDFVMVMPLGPDFAKALAIPVSKLGLIAGSYTGAAAVSGLLGSFFLDRFDRRTALALAMVGLVLGTAAGGMARGLDSLMAARVVAGFFGGPATSLSFSIIADVVTPQRRGKAIGAVMGAFSIASVLGVPAGLELAGRGGWRAPFFAVAGIGLAVAITAVLMLPPMRAHLQTRPDNHAQGIRGLFSRSVVWFSYLMTSVVMTAGFIIIPNISAFVQGNLGYPREKLGWLYMAGGAVSFAALRLVGWLVDRFGSTRVGAVGSAILVATLYFGFVSYFPGLPVMVLFMVFMLGMSFRNVAYNTLATKVPHASERARFMSIQSAIQHLSSAFGAFLSARILRESADHRLEGIPTVAWISIGLTIVFPLLMWRVEREVARPDVPASKAQPLEIYSGINASGPGIPRPLPKS